MVFEFENENERLHNFHLGGRGNQTPAARSSSAASQPRVLCRPSLPVLSFTETDELNWNCELSDWFWSFTELS